MILRNKLIFIFVSLSAFSVTGATIERLESAFLGTWVATIKEASSQCAEPLKDAMADEDESQREANCQDIIWIASKMVKEGKFDSIRVAMDSFQEFESREHQMGRVKYGNQWAVLLIELIKFIEKEKISLSRTSSQISVQLAYRLAAKAHIAFAAYNLLEQSKNYKNKQHHLTMILIVADITRDAKAGILCWAIANWHYKLASPLMNWLVNFSSPPSAFVDPLLSAVRNADPRATQMILRRIGKDLSAESLHDALLAAPDHHFMRLLRSAGAQWDENDEPEQIEKYDAQFLENEKYRQTIKDMKKGDVPYRLKEAARALNYFEAAELIRQKRIARKDLDAAIVEVYEGLQLLGKTRENKHMGLALEILHLLLEPRSFDDIPTWPHGHKGSESLWSDLVTWGDLDLVTLAEPVYKRKPPVDDNPSPLKRARKEK